MTKGIEGKVVLITGGSSGMLPAYSSHRTHIEADVPTSPPSRKIRKDTFSCTSQAFTNE